VGVMSFLSIDDNLKGNGLIKAARFSEIKEYIRKNNFKNPSIRRFLIKSRNGYNHCGRGFYVLPALKIKEASEWIKKIIQNVF